MSRLNPVTLDTAQGKAKDLLNAVKQKMGSTPNIFTAFANSPAAFEGYLNFSGALSGGSLDAQLREKIALATANINSCGYCASAHTFIGGKTGIDAAEMTANLNGKSSDAKAQAALTFATQILNKKGQVSEAEIKAVRSAGFTDEQVVEILANVALNIFTNYFNEAFKTEIDFPAVALKKAA